MDINNIRKKAKNEISNNWQPIFVAYIIVSVAIALTSTVIVGIILIGPLLFGLSSYMLKLTRKQKYETMDLLDGFKKCFESSLVANILTSIFTFLWTLLFIIPGIVKSISYAMVPYILVDDPTLDAQKAIKKSEEMMMGHKMEYFKMILGFLGWIILSILTFGILYLLYVGPYIQTAKTYFYQEVSGKKDVTVKLDYDPNDY